jgi:hypothetical protein
MARSGESVIDRPAVVSEAPRPIHPEQSLGRFNASGRVDLVTRCRQAHERVQPRRPAIDSPAGFVADNLGRATHRTAHFIVGRLKSAGGAKQTSATGATPDFGIKKHSRSRFTLPWLRPSSLLQSAMAA